MKLVEVDEPGALLCICCKSAGELCESDGPDVSLCVCVASQLGNFVKLVEADGPGALLCICCQSAWELCEADWPEADWPDGGVCVCVCVCKCMCVFPVRIWLTRYLILCMCVFCQSAGELCEAGGPDGGGAPVPHHQDPGPGLHWHCSGHRPPGSSRWLLQGKPCLQQTGWSYIIIMMVTGDF